MALASPLGIFKNPKSCIVLMPLPDLSDTINRSIETVTITGLEKMLNQADGHGPGLNDSSLSEHWRPLNHTVSHVNILAAHGWSQEYRRLVTT